MEIKRSSIRNGNFCTKMGIKDPFLQSSSNEMGIKDPFLQTSSTAMGINDAFLQSSSMFHS